MKKTIIQGLLIISVFFGIWFALAQINWVNLFNIEYITDNTEERLGDLFWDVFKKSQLEIKNEQVISSIDSIVSHICKKNRLNKENIKIHVLRNDEINAFAMPNGHLIVYSGLIVNSDNPNEIIGVLCHEIAHIELKHVMKKLIKEIGISVLISISTGNTGTEIIKESVRMLSSSAFDRSLEKEADLKAVDYLVNGNIDPTAFASFLQKIAHKENNDLKYLTWINSHPDSNERADYILAYSKTKHKDFKQILNQQTWEKVKHELNQ